MSHRECTLDGLGFRVQFLALGSDVCIYIYMCACMYIHIYIYMCIPIYAHIHIHICIYSYSLEAPVRLGGSASRIVYFVTHPYQKP